MNYGSATGQERLSRCVGPVLVDHFDITSDAAVSGHEQHEQLLPGLTGSGALPDTFRGRALAGTTVVPCDVETKMYLSPRTWAATVDWSNKAHRDYRDCPPGWIPMTADGLATAERHGEDHLLELKTGDVYVQPDDNWQLLTLALAFRLATGHIPPTRLIQAMSANQKRSGVFEHRRTFSMAQLSAHRRRLVRNMDRVDEARSHPERSHLVTGEHCAECDVQRSGACPAFAARLAADDDGDILTRYVTTGLSKSDADKKRDLAIVALGATAHDTPAGRIEPVTEYRRKIVDVDRAVELYPGLAPHVVRSLPAGALDAYIRETRGRERFADHREAIENELGNGGALAWTPKTTWKVTPSGDVAEDITKGSGV